MMSAVCPVSFQSRPEALAQVNQKENMYRLFYIKFELNLMPLVDFEKYVRGHRVLAIIVDILSKT